MKQTKSKKLKLSQLFSYWTTFYFIVYLILRNYLPKWMNPYPMIIFVTIGQFIISYLGRTFMPYIIQIFVLSWKIIQLLLCMLLIKPDFSKNTLLFNIVFFGLYIGFLKIYNLSIFDSYFKKILNPKAYKNITFKEFIKERLNNIV